jgi:hypothetical protein
MDLPTAYLPDASRQFDAAQRAAAAHVMQRRTSPVPVPEAGGRAKWLLALALTGVGLAVTAPQPSERTQAQADEAPVPLWRSEAFAEDLDA